MPQRAHRFPRLRRRRHVRAPFWRSLGLLVGGAAAQWISWRAGFFINVPIGIAMAVLAPRYPPTTRPQPGRFDLTGALTATLGVGALVFGIHDSAGRGWRDPVVLTSLAGAVVAPDRH